MLAVATVRADAFCHSMVRSDRRLPVRGRGGTPAAPVGGPGPQRGPPRPRDDPWRIRGGLTLEEVGYPDDDELAAQAERTRTKRQLS